MKAPVTKNQPTARAAAGSLHGQLIQRWPIILTTARPFVEAGLLVGVTWHLVTQSHILTSRAESGIAMSGRCGLLPTTIAPYCMAICIIFCGSYVSTAFCKRARFTHSALLTFFSCMWAAYVLRDFLSCSPFLWVVFPTFFLAIFSGYRAFYLARSCRSA
jgi:hypothetical protein